MTGFDSSKVELLSNVIDNGTISNQSRWRRFNILNHCGNLSSGQHLAVASKISLQLKGFEIRGFSPPGADILLITQLLDGESSEQNIENQLG